MRGRKVTQTKLVTVRIPNKLKLALDRMADSWQTTFTEMITDCCSFGINAFYCKKCKERLFGETFTEEDRNAVASCKCEGGR